jgi:hypothetical protein
VAFAAGMRTDGAVGTAITSSAVPGMKGSQLRASLVNRFVNQMRRNRLRQGRRIGLEPEVAASPTEVNRRLETA